MLESLERLLFRAFESQMNYIEELSDSCKATDELSETPNAVNLNNAVSNQELNGFIKCTATSKNQSEMRT